MLFLSDFFDLFYPKVCASCGKNLITEENVICLECLYNIPKTNYYKEKENLVERLFWGRVELEHAASYFHFTKGSIFQKLIHKLKYNGKKEIGVELGKLLGETLRKSEFYDSVDIIVPVPLHPKRQRKRGYNQSKCIADGMSVIMNIPIDESNLIRTKATETQTKKSRIARWENVDNIFQLKNPEKYENKHILLVDDVVTTGATLEACAHGILTAKNAKVSIAVLASAIG
ncbi:MAG: amidophosphoribosyltransferase [Bacteroidetes bacterium GWF2_33_38]|nr:MAG: amidophosphoribosyltransferase [Bacteroidetes bacterium GWF2_33_38]OFY72822.1 MAG: amidophosphoribosyltransferase [Bacteroidetes bacterium RIFOXYA12_FULL_33_9]HBX52600.1 amidophosphoribosyltransferase [Bacteroidales bacterium]